MQTSFSLAQLADPQVAESEKILRACVHCGFCTATCPTYVLLGDELDSPRGRIYLIKEMLEHDAPATPEVVKHIDRCLSCLACMTTCPSGVHYMHLVDHARVHIEETYRRPWRDRLLRALLAWTLPHNERLRWALRAAVIAKPSAPLLRVIGFKRLAAMLTLAPPRLPGRPVGEGRGSALTMDICEYLARLELPSAGAPERLVVAYHAACSLQHGQKVVREPKDVLSRLGFVVKDVAEGHLCCGSAGTYNILQPDIAQRLRARKVGNIEKLAPDVIAAGNIGCI